MTAEIKFIKLEHFSSLVCPACDKNLKPHYNKNAVEPSYYYCEDILSPYGNTPHYKYFNQDGYGYEIYLFWFGSSSGKFYSVKKTIENDICTKVELSYLVPSTDNRLSRPTTRIFSPEDFQVDPKNLKETEDRITRFVEIAEVFE